MPVRSRVSRFVKHCKKSVSESKANVAAIACQKQKELCDTCSQHPWEDITAMSLRKDFSFSSPASISATCILCRLFEALSSLDESIWLQAKHGVIELGFEFDDSDPNVCCLLRSPSVESTFAYPMILLSRLDHAHSISRLQRIYPVKACLESVKKWISDCKSEHEAECALRATSELLDLSVIDCKKMRVVAAPQECKFIALSYVWGKNTSSETEQVGCLPPWHLLPRTIQDCIQVTCELDLRYLWIDRYCIRQDNSEHQRTQISQMGDIYAAAHLTIVAAAGQDPSYGLPGVSSTPRTSIKCEQLGNTRIYALPGIQGLADAFYDSPWVTRAWTFQECFFSRRRLIFTDRQMIFVCNTSTCYEALTKQTLDNGNDDGWLSNCTPRNSPVWLDYVPMARAQGYLHEYSRRHFTFDDDALNAISGALNTLRRDDIYNIWGVPFRLNNARRNSIDHQSDGEICLSWIHDTLVAGLVTQEKQHTPFSRRRVNFPSWSPLGWECKIDVEYPVEIAGIFVQNSRSTTGLQELVTASGIIPADCSQRLRLELETAELAIVRSVEPRYIHWRYEERMVALHHEDDNYVYFQTFWDVDPDTLSLKTTIKGVLLLHTKQSKSSRLHGSACVLLLQPRGSYHERVGIARLHLKAREEGENSRHHETRRKYVHNGNVCKFANSSDIEQTDWWRRHFSKETIILG